MQLDEHRVRGIALNPTQGLARGMTVEDTGGPLKVPAGKGILAHMFDVFGNAIDRRPEPTDVEWRTVPTKRTITMHFSPDQLVLWIWGFVTLNSTIAFTPG